MKWIIALTFSLFSTLAVFTQSNLPELVESIIETNQIHRHYTEWGGVTSIPYPNFEKLKEIASINDLIRLTKHKNGVVRCYAAWALIDLRYPNFEQIFKEIIEHDQEIETSIGCFVMPISISNEVYSRVPGAKYDSLKWATDSIYFITLETKLDELILYHKKANNYLLHQSLLNKIPQEKDYTRIRKLALKKKSQSALVALAEFQKQQDILPIIKYGEGNFPAISVFPNPKFWTYLMQSYPRLENDKSTTQAFLEAVAAFKNTGALKVLNDIIQYAAIKKLGWLLQYVNTAILTNQAEIYDDLIIELWEKHSIIDKTTFRYLKEKESKNFIAIIENGLLNKQEKKYSDYLSYSHYAEYLLKEMLDLLIQQKSNQLIPIVNNLLQTTGYFQLPVITNKIIQLKPESSVPILFSQLESREEIYLKFHITKALLSYQNEAYNHQIVSVLKRDKNWDWGNLSDAFRELLVENGLKLE